MRSESSVEYQYNILVDILADMVTKYLTNDKEKEIQNHMKGEDKNAS
jgi:hypothetical protein